MSRPTRRLVPASVVALVGALALAAWVLPGTSARARPAADPTPAAPLPIYKRGGKKVAFAVDWTGLNEPVTVTAFFGADPTKHALSLRHDHLKKNILHLYFNSHVDEMDKEFRILGPGTITVLATDDVATTTTFIVPVEPVGDGDPSPCDD